MTIINIHTGIHFLKSISSVIRSKQLVTPTLQQLWVIDNKKAYTLYVGLEIAQHRSFSIAINQSFITRVNMNNNTNE